MLHKPSKTWGQNIRGGKEWGVVSGEKNEKGAEGRNEGEKGRVVNFG